MELKKHSITKNIQNTGIYFLGIILQTVFALYAQPIYSKYMSANDFGILGYFDGIKGVLAPIFTLGISTFYLMKFYNQTEEENKKLLFNLTFFLCCFNTIIIFFTYLCLYLYFAYMKVNIPLQPYAWFVLIALILDNIKTVLLINFRIRNKAWTYFSFASLNTLLNVGFGLMLVALFNMGVDGRMLAPIISSILMLPFAIYYLKKYTIVNFNLNIFLHALSVAFPLAMASYGFIVITNIDRFYLERLNDISELGLYSIGLSIAGYIQLAYIAINQAFEPSIFKSVAEKDFKKLIKIGLAMLIPFLFLVLIFLFFSGYIISILTAGKFLEAEKYANITIISIYLISVFYFFVSVILAMGKSNLNLIVNTIGGLFSIIIMYYAVNLYGFIGAAYSKILIAAFMVLLISITVIFHIRQLKTTT